MDMGIGSPEISFILEISENTGRGRVKTCLHSLSPGNVRVALPFIVRIFFFFESRTFETETHRPVLFFYMSKKEFFPIAGIPNRYVAAGDFRS
jgi:hypothetical protein